MTKKVLHRFLPIFTLLDEHTIEIIKKSSSSTIVKVIGMTMGLLVSVFLGRTIGPDGVGIINLCNRIVNILIVVGLLGIPQVIIKEVAIANDQNNYIHIGNVMHTAYWINGGLTFILSIILILISPWLAVYVFNEPRLSYPLMIALGVMTPQVFSRLFSSGFIGYRKIWQSNLAVETLSIVVTGIILLILWLLDLYITVNRVAVAYAIGRIAVTITTGLYWRSLYNYKSKYKFIHKYLMTTSIPIFWGTIAAIIMSNADAIMLGWLTSSKEIGLYTIAARIALLTSFFLQVTNSALSPKIATLYENKRFSELEGMVQKVTKGLSIIGLIQLIVFIVAGKYILNIWGSEFVYAYWILIILSIGQFFNIGTGAVGIMLIMCGYERIQSKIALISIIFYLVLNYFLIVPFGSIGLAISTAFTIASINIIRVFYVKKKIGISTIPIKIF